jgi:HEAT repeat protein
MGHEHEDIRNLAASSVAMLARPGDGSFLPRVYPLLDDASVLVRMSAVEAIRAIADPVSVETLLALLPSEPRAVQRKIVLALGAIGDPVALPALQELERKVAALPDPSIPGGAVRGSDPRPSEIARLIREAIVRLETSPNAPNG